MSHYNTVKQVKEDLNHSVTVLQKAPFCSEENFPKAEKSRLKQKEWATSNEERAWICQRWRAITTVAVPCLREYAVSFLIKTLTWAGRSLGEAHMFSSTPPLLSITYQTRVNMTTGKIICDIECFDVCRSRLWWKKRSDVHRSSPPLK